MNKIEVKKYLQREVLNNPTDNLKYFLSNHEIDSIKVIEALLYTLGYLYIRVDEETNTAIFHVAVRQEDMLEKVRFDKPNNELTGDLSEDLAKAFLLVNKIETQLNNAVLLPPQIRDIEIDNTCKALNINSEFYNLVLRGW